MMSNTKEISDAAIKAALKSNCGYLYDIRRVEFHINAARTGGTFYDVVYKGKKRQRTKLAKWPAVSAKVLFDELPAIRGNALADREVQLTLPRYKKGEQVLCWFMQHMDDNKALSAAYVATASSYIGNHLLGMLDQVSVRAIDVAFLREKFHLARQNGYALSTIKGLFGVLKKAFSSAYEAGVIARHPLKHITFRCFALDTNDPIEVNALEPQSGLKTGCKEELNKGQLNKGQKRRLGIEDLSQLRAAIDTLPMPARVFFTLQWCYGNDIREIRLAQAQQFCRDRLEWQVPASNSKNGQQQRLLIAQQSMDLIDGLVNVGVSPHRRYVFSTRGDKPISQRTLERWYQRLSDALGVKLTASDMAKLLNEKTNLSISLH